VLEPKNPDWTLRFNPLELQNNSVPEHVAASNVDAFAAVFDDDPQTAVRFYRVAYHALLALALAGKTLADVPRFLTNRLWREDLVAELEHDELTRYWLQEFPRANKGRGEREALEMVGSTLNRIGRLIAHPDVKKIFAGKSTFTFRSIMDEGKILLVSVPIGRFGKDICYLVLALILNAIFQAGFSREDISEAQRTACLVVADEYQNFASRDLLDVVSGGRKWGLEFMLLSQSPRGQGGKAPLMREILNTVGTVVSFRLSHEDADAIVRELFSPDLVQEKARTVRTRWQRPFGIDIPYTDIDSTYFTLEELWEMERRKIVNLPDRFMWVKRRGYGQPQIAYTPELADINQLPGYHHLEEALREQERAIFARYGVPKEPPVLSQPQQRSQSDNDSDEDDPLDYSQF
jgi:hypothetical protein